MKTNHFYIWTLCLLGLLGFSSCDESMDDNYKEYLVENNYSGKVKALRCYIGYERVVLAWDNPTDQKSKTILIEYAEGLYKHYESLVDSVSIDGLTSGSGYEFVVYTLDADSNKSVPVSITALPISADFVSNLVAPACVAGTKDGVVTVNFNGLTSISYRFAGKITYKIKNEAGQVVKEGTEEIDVYNYTETGEIKSIKSISTHSFNAPELTAGNVYQIEYTVSIWPLSNRKVTLDKVDIDGSARLNIR